MLGGGGGSCLSGLMNLNMALLRKITARKLRKPNTREAPTIKYKIVM
jgi:hypothetical protein